MSHLVPSRASCCVALTLLALVGMACAPDKIVQPTQQRAGLRFVPVNVKDTIEATIVEPIMLELLDTDLKPRAGIEVVIGATSWSETAFDGRVANRPEGPFGGIVVDTTDASGRAEVWIRLGTRARISMLVARAGAERDSLAIETLHGNAVGSVLAPADTALWVSRSYQLRITARDRYANEFNEPGAVASSMAGGIAVTGTGQVSGVSIGRHPIQVARGAARDTAWVSVVPTATFVVFANPLQVGKDAGIYVLRSDGSGGRWVLKYPLVTVESDGFGPWPTWSRDTTQIVYVAEGKLRRVGANGVNPVEIVSSAEPVSDEFGPQYGQDGWIYFTKGYFGSQRTFWRVRPDGTGAAQVSEVRTWGVEAMPTPSPGGDKIAYQTNDVTNSPSDFTLRFISTTGSITKVDVPGSSPRWAPTGDKIAYLDESQHLKLMSSTGAVIGKVGPGVPAQPGFSWSPDAQWVVAVNYTGLCIINMQTGAILPLPFSGPNGQWLRQPAWQP